MLPDRLHEADVRLFRRIARSKSPALDATLPPLTRAADHGRLWVVIGVLLALLGRRRRRGAVRGLASAAAASFVANIPAKLVLRRTRPTDDVPKHRRLLRKPRSTSFPSGHSATALAFATGVALESPEAGVPLLAVASAVAYSRVFVGVHYPSDVLTGAAIGVGVALVSRRIVPQPRTEFSARSIGPASIDDPIAPDGEGLAIVVNPQAGGGSGPSVEDIRLAFPRATLIETSDSLDIEHALERAAAAGRVLGICGGDGSVNSAAQLAIRYGLPLVVIPGGTLNHFARDAALQSLEDVKDAVANRSAIYVDVGGIADRPFLNTASIGAYADLVDARERLEDRIGKWPAMAIALVRVLRTAEPVDVDINGERCRVWMSFFGNCHYEPVDFAPRVRARLDDGAIDVRVVDGTKRFSRMRFAWAVLTGTLHRSRVFRSYDTSDTIAVSSHEGPLRLAVDGETFDGPATFTISKRPRALIVYAPSSGGSRAASAPRAAGSERR